jgi:hypothetical protein
MSAKLGTSFDKTHTNCYLAIVEEPFEPYDFLSYGREVGSPFAKSILMCGFDESSFDKTHSVQLNAA